MESQADEQKSSTNCLDCERYKTLGEVCVIEHEKKFLWEFCKDFQSEVRLPDYDDLMKEVKQDMAAERKKLRQIKEKEIVKRRKEREIRRKERLRLKRSKIAKRAWEKRREMAKPKKREKNRFGEKGQAKIPKTASSANATA